MKYHEKFNLHLNWIKLLLFSIATLFVSQSYAQETNSLDDFDIDKALDELFFNDQELVQDLLNAISGYDFLYSTVTYNSNTFFAGRDVGIDQLNLIPQISYFSSSGFNATVSSIYYEQQDPKWDFVSIGGGYGNTIGKKKNVHYNVGYTRYFYSDGWDDFNNSLDFLFGVRNTKRSLGATINASYLFGEDQSLQLTSRLYGDFTLSRTAKSSFRFRPQLSFLMAEQVISTILPPPRPAAQARIVTTEEFSLLNTQLYVPISWSSASFDIELGYNFNLPNPISNEGSLDNTSFFTLSVGYLIDFTKRN